MALSNKVLKKQTVCRAYPSRPIGRLVLCKARVIDKPQTQTFQASQGFSDSSEEDGPSSSGNSLDASKVLFDEQHIATWRPDLILYAPFGILLAALRSALWLLGIALDQPWFRRQGVVQAYLKLLGVTVTWRHAERIPAGRHILVSNHCSVGDLMALFSHPALPRRYIHLVTSSLPPRVTQARNLPVIMRPASPAVYDQLAKSGSSSSGAGGGGEEGQGDELGGSVHLFPEGGMTNGRGMLRFSRGFTRIMQQQQQRQQQQQLREQQQPQPLQRQQQWESDSLTSASQDDPSSSPPATTINPTTHHSSTSTSTNSYQASATSTEPSHSSTATPNPSSSSCSTPPPGPLPVVPVALRVRPSLSGVCSHTLTSSFLANLFWFSFSPETRLEATVLPAMSPQEGESRGAFVRRVQEAIAGELGVTVFDMSIQQKRQLVGKRAGR
ncbi:hypothetical protein Agub_g9579 [Astrephomene gubernaculifera]|uniref:Phospholipid/glycerol acyltransferase domain-containing protein n=1 Tax=Astrephomene gubernaculifera TaxID=47775 RepID=A0AAD3DTZ2_9CHLO|nr:hypothetical protein Agub_g9579 [Astrephomene gubernaculifera]